MYCRPQGSGRGDDFRVWWLGDVDNVPENDWMNIDIRKDHADYMDIHASYMPTVASVEDPATVWRFSATSMSSRFECYSCVCNI